MRGIQKALRARSEEMAQMITREIRQTNQSGARWSGEIGEFVSDWYAEHGPAMLKAEPTLVESAGQLLSIDRWGRFWRLCRGTFRYGR